MRVAFVHQPWSVLRLPFSEADAIAIWTEEIAHCLASSGTQVMCYSRHEPGLALSEHSDGVDYRRFNVGYDRWTRAFRVLDETGVLPARRSFAASGWYYRNYARQIASDIAKWGGDVIHIQNFSQFVPVMRRFNPNAIIVLHMHNTWLSDFHRPWIERRLAGVDAVVTCSNYVGQALHRSWPELAKPVRTVYNGYSDTEFVPQRVRENRPRRILFVGRIAPDKGSLILVDAFNGLAAKFPDVELTMVGPVMVLGRGMGLNLGSDPDSADFASTHEGGYLDHLKRRQTPEAARRTRFTGVVPHDCVAQLMRSADVLVLPSLGPETFGMPIVEAAGCGIPAVVSRRGGMPEIVEDGRTGIIFEPGDVAALEHHLADLLDHPAKRLEMGEAAQKFASTHFTWPHLAEEIAELYDQLMASSYGAEAEQLSAGTVDAEAEQLSAETVAAEAEEIARARQQPA